MLLGRALYTAAKVALVATAVSVPVYRAQYAPVPVQRHVVARGEIVAEVMGTGTLESPRRATVGSKAPGRIEELFADQGDRVRRGAIVARLDDREARQEVEVQESAVRTARAAIDRLIADRRRAETVLAQARRDLPRAQQLFGKGAFPKQELERVHERVDLAEADVARALAAIAEGREQAVSTQRRLELSKVRLDDTVIRAPFDCLVVRRHREPGDIVVPASPVLSLVADGELWISAWADETELSRLVPGQPARVVFRSEPGASYRGRLVRVGREADRETREMPIDVRVDQLPKALTVGQRAEVYVEVSRRRDVTVVPAAFIHRRDLSTGVLVEDSGRARWREITVGLMGQAGVEIVRGLAPGDVVLGPGSATAAALADGQRVSVP